MSAPSLPPGRASLALPTRPPSRAPLLHKLEQPLAQRDDPEIGYHLQPSGRFAHRKEFILETLAAHGFSSGRGERLSAAAGGGEAYFGYEQADLRKEGDTTLRCHLVLAQRL